MPDPAPSLDNVLATLRGRRYQAREKLFEFLRLPSVSTKPDHKEHVRRCAQWLADELARAQLQTSVMETAGHPVVVAKNKHVAGRPTVLLYGHYDVQPPEPLDLWTTPAFEPTLRKDANGHDAIFARGAVDDKGQVYAHVEAITAWQAHGGVPLNLTVLIEGEEEIGSPNLEAFIRANAAALKADVCLISDTGAVDRDTPAIEYGLRGLVYLEVTITGPSHDLHSGTFGGAAPNPANELCRLIASLHDADGRVNLPGFYDAVLPLGERERSLLSQITLDEDAWRRDLKIAADVGEKGYSILERTTARPTLDVNGLTAGYQGAGAKTVIASKASAKVSMRLVPHQDPAAIRASFERAIADRIRPGFTFSIASFGEAAPVITPIDSPATKLAAEAIEKVFGRPPVFSRSGGTIPVAATIKTVLGCDALFVGFGLPDDRMHSPDEKFDLEMFHRGIDTAACLYERLAKLK